VQTLPSTTVLQAMAMEGIVGTKKVSVSNGRLLPAVRAEAAEAPSGKMVLGWNLGPNGFCLLTDQPMPVQQSVFDEVLGQSKRSFIFQFQGS